MATDESDPSNADVNDGRAMVSPLGIFNLQKLQPVIEVMAKLFLAGSVFLYSLGLFISNLYFQQFGLTTFSLFKAQYVLVGLLWFLLMVLCLIITAGVFDGVRALIRAQNGEISKHRASSMKVFW